MPRGLHPECVWGELIHCCSEHTPLRYCRALPKTPRARTHTRRLELTNRRKCADLKPPEWLVPNGGLFICFCCLLHTQTCRPTFIHVASASHKIPDEPVGCRLKSDQASVGCGRVATRVVGKGAFTPNASPRVTRVNVTARSRDGSLVSIS